MASGSCSVEDLVVSFWAGKRVLVTGHTGFKGSWLSLWLTELGAHVTGIALEPETSPSLFQQLALAELIDHRIQDIRDGHALDSIVADVAPEVIFHLAAQSLVIRSYQEPVDTWAVNVLGTLNLLNALHTSNRPCAAVMVATDKVYENREWEFGYREVDPLGGHDPYSASKAAMEIAVSSWRRSFCAGGALLRIGSARAGNVIGGGDWAENRIIPDLVRAVAQGKPVVVRNRLATRPWQHVLEPLGGYLLLAEALAGRDDAEVQDAFNFGPDAHSIKTVGELVAECFKHWPGEAAFSSDPQRRHEASRLNLAIERARDRLGWRPRWTFARNVAETLHWYKAAEDLSPQGVRDLCVDQIRRYMADADEGL